MHSEPSPNEVTAELAQFLRGYTFKYSSEDALQLGIEEALTEAGAPFTRELRLDERSRIDFAVHALFEVGIEIKVDSAASEVERQVRRYLKHDAIDGLVLVTTRRRHRDLLRREFEKPFEVVWLGSSAF